MQESPAKVLFIEKNVGNQTVPAGASSLRLIGYGWQFRIALYGSLMQPIVAHVGFCSGRLAVLRKLLARLAIFSFFLFCWIYTCLSNC